MNKRSRSAAGKTAAQATRQGHEDKDIRDPSAGKRRQRVPIGQGLNLAVYESGQDDENYYRHWFYESPTKSGKLEQAKSAGYEFCLNSQGEQIVRASGPGKQYLMKLPKEYREEDLELKRDKSMRKMRDQTMLKRNEYAPTREGKAEGGDSMAVDRHGSGSNPYERP